LAIGDFRYTISEFFPIQKRSFFVQNKTLLIFFVVLALAAIGYLWLSPGSKSSSTPHTISGGAGTDAAGLNFILKDLQGNNVSLKDYRGKVVLVNFWAHWCPPCVKEIPDLVKLRQNYKDNGFEILGVVVPFRADQNQVRNMVNKFGIDYPVLWGTNEAVAQFGDIPAIPRTFILNGEGQIVEDLEGMGNYRMFESLVKKHLKG